MEIKGKKWNGNLNYAGAMHLDLDCDIIDLAIIDIIEDYVKLKYIKKTILDGDLLFKFDWHYIPKRCPYLPSQSRSSIFSRLEKLERLCLIERVDLKVNEMWFKFGSRYEDFINAAESSKTDSDAKTVRHGGLPESGTVDSPESGAVDSISRDTTSCDNTSESEQKKSKNKPLQEINTCEEVKEIPFNIQAKAKVKELIPDYYFDETYDWKALTEIDYYLVNYLQAQEEILGTKILIDKRLEAFEVLIRHVLEKEKWFTFDLSGINKNKNKFWNACKSDLGKQLKSDNWDDFMAKHYLDRDIPQFNSVYQRNNILADLTRDIVSRLRAIGEIDKAIVIEMQYQKVEWEELYKLALDQVKFTQAEYEKIAIW